jgi:hypothetical protein
MKTIKTTGSREKQNIKAGPELQAAGEERFCAAESQIKKPITPTGFKNRQ